MEDHYYAKPKSATRTLFNLSVIACLLLVGFSVFYYLVIFLPGQERSKKEYIQNQKMLTDSCLKIVEQSYKDNWNKNCKSKNLEPNCNLPSTLAESIENNRKQLRDECYKRYPQ